MRIGLLTEGGYPYASGETRAWCDRLVRGLTGHDFEVYALGDGSGAHAPGRDAVRPRSGRRGARRGRTAGVSRRERQRFAGHFADLAAAFCGPPGEAGHEADRFAAGLYGLADLARGTGALPELLRSETAVRILEAACRAPGALPAARAAQVTDLLAVTEALDSALRPLSLDWYGDGTGGPYGDGRGAGPEGRGLGGVDLCHVTCGGPAALTGLLAKRFCGTPLLVTEYGVRLREHHLGRATAALSSPVHALLAAFEGALAAETYRTADLITPGNTRIRRWQERCGAPRDRLRTVYPGMDAGPFARVPDAAADDSKTLVWVGTVEPDKDLIGLLHAFAQIRAAEPDATLRIIGAPGAGPEAPAYLAHCRALAAQLFPDEAASAVTVGENPVSFEKIGDPGVAGPADAYEAGAVLVLSSVVGGFPRTLVEAMFCGRATVSTDVGAVCEVIGGTGLVVPPRNPRALADACTALLGDPERRARLGAAARARALELFTVEQNIAAFRGIYLELMSRAQVRHAERDVDGAPRPFARPAESRLPDPWGATGPSSAPQDRGHTPSWARPPAVPHDSGARVPAGLARSRGGGDA
ncbi:glycosyltransferase [Streptomyces purpurogeneiscleroticus]|uniref:glycosyltransferase n=1 Tax=Streptomyces purpurogeneiscleroticus TaxID=68259 RepID=UPI001CBE3CEB|nr:glycosyltransferase [Streptomyces purpurogeneiscleroticus]MBZ4017153.1 transferase [Streptomyces purpurogeneiscleroticus]